MTLAEWKATIKPPGAFVFQATARPPQPPLQKWLIGMGPGFHLLSTEEKKAAQTAGTHTDIFHYACRIPTDTTRRPSPPNRASIDALLAAHGIANRTVNPSVRSVQPTAAAMKAYLSDMGECMFAISPEGNRVDCFRHTEAIYVGTIPIVEYHPHIERLYDGLPVLWTRNAYADIVAMTPSDLKAIYAEAETKTYNFTRLFKAAYGAKISAEMEGLARYWIPIAIPGARLPYEPEDIESEDEDL